MGNLSQSNRMGALKTPLGEDALVLKSFSGDEGLGELFEFDVEALSEQENINFDPALGQGCTIKLKTHNDKERYFCGILARAQWAGRDPEYLGDTEKYFSYRLVLRPWFWLLNHRADCRIFLDKKVTEIIQDVFTKAGFSNGTDFKLPSGSYDKIEYCVQYRETDFAFVSRLMEQYGIYYFFEHKDGRHTMVLADSRSSHSAIPDLPSVRYNPATVGYNRQEQNLLTWVSHRHFRTRKIKFKDYDYLKPPKNLLVHKEAAENYNPTCEVYDYPAKYDEEDKGEQFAKFRLEAEQALDHRRQAGGDAPSIFAGGLVSLEKHPTSAENKEYLVVRAVHRFGTQHYRAFSTESVAYSGNYEFQPSDRPFRSLPLTPKPRIYGIQTAKVVAKKGEDGEEISTDKHGRIWVKFFWDREPQKTCPIRVAQVWAGKQWGGQFIPRVDMEVVVEFLEGDPDRPLVVGCVFNGDNEYPYGLPDNKTQSGLKSDSSKGHGGYNELMFEDSSGGEFIRMYAQLDHLVTVNRHQTGSVGAVGPDDPTGGNQTWTVGGNRSWTIQMGNDTTDVQMGNQTINIDMGTQSVEAMQGITLSVCMGLSTISITPASISITAPEIDLTAEATINITAPVINLTGVVNIVGGLTVDGQAPVLV